MPDVDTSIASQHVTCAGLPLAGRRRLTAAEDDTLRQSSRRLAVTALGCAVALPLLVALAAVPGLPSEVVALIALLGIGLLAELGGQAATSWHAERDRRHGWVYVFGEEQGDDPACVIIRRSARVLTVRGVELAAHSELLSLRGTLDAHLRGQDVRPAPPWFELTAPPDGSDFWCCGEPRRACRPLTPETRASHRRGLRAARLKLLAKLVGSPLAMVATLVAAYRLGWLWLVVAGLVVGLIGIIWCWASAFDSAGTAARLAAVLRDGQHHGFVLLDDTGEHWADVLGGGMLHRLDGRAPDQVTIWPLYQAAPPPPEASELPTGALRALTDAERDELAEAVHRMVPRRGIGCLAAAFAAIVVGAAQTGDFIAGLVAFGLGLSLYLAVGIGVVRARWRRCQTARADLAAGVVEVVDQETRTERLPRLGTLWSQEGVPCAGRSCPGPLDALLSGQSPADVRGNDQPLRRRR